MGKWDEFNKKYGMTAEDWKEWRETKQHYKKGGIFHCERCTNLIKTSPLITFLIRKGKIKRILCSKCEQESLDENEKIER
jgi:transcription elongation factor Elf1